MRSAPHSEKSIRNSAAEFISELKTLIGDIVINVLSDNSSRQIEVKSEEKVQPDKPKKKRTRAPSVKSIEEILCPLCGKGHLLKGRSAYGSTCSPTSLSAWRFSAAPR